MAEINDLQIKALRYYVGEEDAYPGAPSDAKAYCTLNTLFYGDAISERSRVKEGKKLNPDFITNDGFLVSLCSDIINAAIIGGKDEKAETVYRVAREADVDAMLEEKKTMTFTSTSKNGFLESYSDKSGLVLLEVHIPENAPRADIAKLIPDYKKPEEAEVLLPPWLPITLTELSLSAKEKLITDRDGRPPIKKYRVDVKGKFEPSLLFNRATDDKAIAAGKRVINALINGKEPDKEDEAKYIEWKKGLILDILLSCKLMEPLRDTLQRGLDSLSYITGGNHNTNQKYRTDDMFDGATGRAWIRTLLGIGVSSSLSKRIETLSDPRITHTITTFLLGYLFKNELGLGFEGLPRIFSKNNSIGDPFPFFWAIACLCHDLGYYYENAYLNKPERFKMNKAYKRRSFLGLSAGKDLMELKEKDLEDYDLTENECKWAKKSIGIMREYNRYRLKVCGCVDHGIAGALILFDELRKMWNTGKKPAERKTSVSASKMETGFASANRGHSRFMACGILIALTVARHNMWTKKAEDSDKAVYEEYNLKDLIVDGNKNKLSVEDPLDGLLFLLELLDTIDPLKGLYLRHIEPINDGTGIFWKKVFTEHTGVCFCRGSADEEHRVLISIDIPKNIVFPQNDCIDIPHKGTVDKYIEGTLKVDEWMDITKPERRGGAMVVFMPFKNREPFVYKYEVNGESLEINEEELLDACFYEGAPGSSRPSLFYSLPNAYQTLNLLMMGGLEGEDIRIGIEKQIPNSIYIKNWRDTVRVFENIFTAQCIFKKVSDAEIESLQKAGKKTEKETLWRGDRRVNADMMIKNGRTFAFTSTSKDRLHDKFVATKNDPVVEEIHPNESIPVLDYLAVLGKDYVYVDEAEVLLPPFIKIGSYEYKGELELDPSVNVKAQKLNIDLCGIELEVGTATEEAYCMQLLDKNSPNAAEALDQFIQKSGTNGVPYALCNAYIDWKTTFQKLIRLRFSKIYNEYCM